MKTSHKGFVAPLLLALIALLVAGGGAYVYLQKSQTNQSMIVNSAQTTSTAQTTNDTQTSDWKTYTNTQYGFSFQYPSYLGDVVIASSSPYCPEMKTYSRWGQVDGIRTKITFSKNPTVGNTGSYMTYIIPIVQKAKTDPDVCGTNLLALVNSLATDPLYASIRFRQENSIETYKSTLDTTVGTSANVFYTLVSRYHANITVIQPTAVFIPYGDSNESKAIDDTTSKIKKSGNENLNPNSAIVLFLNKENYADENLNKSTRQVKSYLDDFERLVQSIKFIQNPETSLPVDKEPSKYIDPSQIP